MYIPAHFNQPDIEVSYKFMNQYPFATLITTNSDLKLNATHLPFVIEKKEGKIFLTSHIARANKQWKDFEVADVLVIFSEPHAYISTSLYEKQQNVPTWNYVAVHATGNAQIEENEDKGYAFLEKMISFYEAEYMQQWKKLDHKYKNNLFKAIVPFFIEVKKIECKEKLSQNKSENEKRNIVNHLSESENAEAKAISKIMKNKYFKE